MKLLIDGDLICYRAGFATDKTKFILTSVDGDGNTFASGLYDDAKSAKAAAELTHKGQVWSRKDPEPEDKALMLVDVMIRDIKERYAQENPDLVLFLTGVGNHRYSIATRASYKGNRSGAAPPCHLRAIRNHLVSKYGAVVSQGREADDDIALAAAEFPDCLVCSTDKDLMQIKGRHFDFVKKEEVTVSAKEANLNFFSQCISGDATDAIPGATGYGPVKSRKALEGAKGPADCWKRIVDIYTNEFGTDGTKYALECARLVKIGMPRGVLWQAPA